jgi:hypothetical protein
MWHQILAESDFEQFVPQAGNKFRVWWCSLKSCRPAEGRKELATRAIAYCRQILLERNNHCFERAAALEETII